MEIRHKDLSYAVMACVFRVHNELGPGFPERVYHVALCRELTNAGIPFESEVVMEVHYDGVLCGSFKADIVVDGKIVLELKAVACLVKVHAAQALSYLRASGLRLAIVINFGKTRIEHERIVT